MPHWQYLLRVSWEFQFKKFLNAYPYFSSALRGRMLQGRGRSIFWIVIMQILPPCSTRSNILQISFKIGKTFCISGMEELGSDEKKFHVDLGSEILIGENDLVILIGEKAAWFAEGLITTGCRDNQIIVLGEIEDAISIVEDFEGAILFKGSRSYKLEKLLTGWAIDNELENETEC